MRLHFEAVLCKGKRASLGMHETVDTLDVARVGMQLSNVSSKK